MTNETVFKCEWCPCFFFNEADLEAHKQAFKITGTEPNQYDHKVAWQIELRRRMNVENYGEPE
jgi:hypothetical protein